MFGIYNFKILWFMFNLVIIKSLGSTYLGAREKNRFDDGESVETADKSANYHTNKNNNLSLQRHRYVSQICPVSLIRKGQIIKTNESIQAGAKFLDTPLVGTVKECHEKCCSLLHCNTAVVKVNINKVSCYLFDCGIVSRCSFDNHKDYKVIALKNQEQAENEDATSTSFDEIILKNTSHEEIKPKCQIGYHVVGNECRENCSNDFYFECVNVDRPAFKQCIATYDKCDGYQQCDDNSDEINCSSNQDVKAEVHDNISVTVTQQPLQKFPNSPDANGFIKINSLQEEIKTYDKLPHSLNFYSNLNMSALHDSFKNSTNSIELENVKQFGDNQLYWQSKYVPYNNHFVDLNKDQRELRHDNPHLRDQLRKVNPNVEYREVNTSSYDVGFGGLTNHDDNDAPSKITNNDKLANNQDDSLNAINILKHTKNKHYMQDIYGRNFKDGDVYIDPYKLRGTTLKGPVLRDGTLLKEIVQRPQNTLNTNMTSSRKNIINWNSRFYDNAVRGTDKDANTQWNGGEKLDIKHRLDKNEYGKQHLLVDSNYAKELADYGNRINKIPTEHGTLLVNDGDRIRQFPPNYQHNYQKYDFFDLDKVNPNVLGNPYYDTNLHLQNHIIPTVKQPHGIFNYHKKFSAPNKNVDNKYFPKEVDSISNYLAPSDNRLDYYIEYDSDPKQLYDYEYKLQNPLLDPYLHQKSMLPRISSNHFIPEKVRAAYFNGIPSKESPNKYPGLRAHSHLGEEQWNTSTQSMTQVVLTKTATYLTELTSNLSPAHNINTSLSPTSSSSKSSLLRSFSSKYIELSKFSKHKVDDFKGGAVVVLSLGIGMVVVLLAVFACQLQKFKKQGRNRKAKNMDSDSDYLINGLYL